MSDTTRNRTVPPSLPHRQHDPSPRPRLEGVASGIGPWSRRVEHLADRACAPVMRLTIAVLFLWFGIPKLFPGASPAEDLAVRTVEAMTGNLLHGDVARLAVGVIELAIGVALVIGRRMRLVLLALVGHLCATAVPLVLFPDEMWRRPGVGTLEGQYILKNLVLLAGVVVLAARSTGPGQRDAHRPD